MVSVEKIDGDISSHSRDDCVLFLAVWQRETLMNFEKIVIIYICIFILTTDKPMAKALDVGGARTDFSQAAELYIN